MLIRNGLTANMAPLVLLGGGYLPNNPDTAISLSNLGFGKLAAMPWGYSHPYQISLPVTAGGITSFRGVSGAGAFVGAIAGGKNGSATLSGSGNLVGVGDLIVSMVAALTGSGTISSATAQAFLNLTASLAGEGDLEGAATAIGHAAAALTGTGAATGTATALGTLAAEITVTGDLLTTANVASAVWSVLIESGLTAQQAMRLISAATAGKVTISGNTVTISNAVDDDVDRIVATTTVDGERTAITYDLD
jgi:hypothetical protein